MTELPHETLPTTYITGAGYTLSGDSFDFAADVEAGANVDIVHDALSDYSVRSLLSLRTRASLIDYSLLDKNSCADEFREMVNLITTRTRAAAAEAAAHAPPFDASDSVDEHGWDSLANDGPVNESTFLLDLESEGSDEDDFGSPTLVHSGDDWGIEYDESDNADHAPPPGASRMADARSGNAPPTVEGDEAGDNTSEDQRNRKGRLRVTKVPMLEWHNIFGHASASTVRATLRARGFRAFDDCSTTAPFHCDTCAIANAKKSHRGGNLGLQRDMAITEPGQLVCIDVLHLAPVESLTGIDKALIAIDRASGFGVVAPYTLNSDGPGRHQLGGVITRTILEFRRLSQYSATISVHSDLALDEINTYTEENLTAMGAIQFGGAAYHSNTNPTAEVTIRIIRNMARAFAVGGGTPPSFSFMLMLQAMAVYNDLVGSDGKSPRQRITGASTPYACPFDKTPGQLAFAFKAPNRSKSKQDTRGHAVVYIGRGALVKQVGFACWDPVAMCVFVTPSVRFPRIPFADTRFPFLEGLAREAIRRAKHELKIQAGIVQPYDASLPNGMIAGELIGRKVKARRESGRGYETGEVTTCRYVAQGLGDELLFGVRWRKVGDGREIWYNFEELGGILVDDSGIEMLINLALTSPSEAEATMADATSFSTLLHTARHNVAKRHDKKKERSMRGRINETTWTDIRFALRDARSQAEKQLWYDALKRELDRMFKELEVFDWTALQEGDIGPMNFTMPCRIKLQGDLHTDTTSVYKVRCVGGTSKKEIERRYGEPMGGWESFAATIAHNDLLHMLAICVELKLSLYSLDVEAAYLHAEMPRDNIVYQPQRVPRARPDQAILEGEARALRMGRVVQGLVQAPPQHPRQARLQGM